MESLTKKSSNLNSFANRHRSNSHPIILFRSLSSAVLLRSADETDLLPQVEALELRGTPNTRFELNPIRYGLDASIRKSISARKQWESKQSACFHHMMKSIALMIWTS